MSELITPVATFMRRLVELLAVDATAEDLSALSSEARANGIGATDLNELEQAIGAALRVRRSLRQHRRREMELTALFDTAGDLAGLRDLDAVLQSIVRRAKMLLGTDTAYLTLQDEKAGDTYMRVTAGSVSSLFQNLRLELGEGLGGLVAQTSRPYATPDYRADSRFRHTGSIDAGVGEEGLVGILGVPLILGDGSGPSSKVIGVLFAADRTPRPFSPDEVALLCTLAAHAAIAIDTARTIDDNRSALTDLAAANTVIQEHAASVQRAEEAHDRLTDLVLRGGDLPDVAAAVSELLGTSITIHDTYGHPLTAARDDRSTTGYSCIEGATLVKGVGQSHTAARAVFHDGHWICAVLAGPEILGSLVMHDCVRLDDADRRLFERAGVVTALLLLLRRSVAETENRIHGELIADLLTAPDRDPSALVRRGRRLGIDLSGASLLLVAETTAGARERLAGAAVQYLFAGPGISSDQAGTVVLLLPDDGTPPGEAARNAVEHLAPLVGAPVTVAAAGPASGPQNIAAAHGEAVRTLRVLQVLGRSGDGAGVAELGFLGVLLGNEQDVEAFITATLGPLMDYDARRGTELVRTLEAYFACGGILTRTKEVLHLHVNTVVQRLDRVEALLGPEWNHPEPALELQLALRLRLLVRGR